MKNVFIILLFGFLSNSIVAQVQNTQEEPRQENLKVKVFPNPATNVVNILGLLNSNRAHIVISDTYGNMVLQHHWAIKEKSLSIPIAQLNPGIYIIIIVSKEQRVQTKFYKK